MLTPVPSPTPTRCNVRRSLLAQAVEKERELETFRQRGLDLVRQLDVTNAMLATEREARARQAEQANELDQARQQVSVVVVHSPIRSSPWVSFPI
eukprot:9287115-Pyramimonas_sp.AAC.3